LSNKKACSNILPSFYYYNYGSSTARPSSENYYIVLYITNPYSKYKRCQNILIFTTLVITFYFIIKNNYFTFSYLAASFKESVVFVAVVAMVSYFVVAIIINYLLVRIIY
jgi:hypothetical protein